MAELIRILYIDDDPVLLDIARIALERVGEYSITSAESAVDALSLLTEKTFDAIVSDYEMDQMNGIELLKHLRAKGDTTPFIIFTGKGREEVVIEALNSGVDFYLQKRGQPNAVFVELSNQIHSAVSRKRSETDLLRKNEELHAAYEEIAATEEELRVNLDELTRMESIIRLSEGRLLMAQEIGQTGCWEYTIETNTIWGSAEGLRIFGFPPIAGDFLIDEIESCIPDRERVHQALVDLLTDGLDYNLEYDIHPADGSTPKVIHSVARLEKDTQGNLLGVMGIIKDITEQKHAESLLKETNEAFVQAQKIAHVGSWMYDLKADKITWSDELYRVFGHDPGTLELKLDIIRTTFHPEDLEKHDRILKTAIDTRYYEPTEYRLIYPDGSLHYCNANGSAEVDENGVVVRLIGVCQDITEQKLVEGERERLIEDLGASNEELSATFEELLGTENELKSQYNALATSEENLRQTKDYLEMLISIANVPIIIWDSSFQITRINRAFEILIGRPAEEVVGNSFEILFPPDESDRTKRFIENTHEGVRWETTEIEIIKQDGSRRLLLWNSSTLYSSDGVSPIATIAQGQDITDQRRLEQEKEKSIVQIQKNIAQLTMLNDGIRNPLMVIAMCVDEVDNLKISHIIQDQITQIDLMINQVDQRWIESEKILEYLRKHYQIDITHSSEQNSKDTGLLQPERDEPLVEDVQDELSIILDNIDALVYAVDLNTYEILFINRRFRDLFGDIIGQRCYSSMHGYQDGPCPFCTSHLLIDHLEPTGVYQWEYLNTKTERWYDCRDRAIRWSDGRLVRLEIATDITDRKHAEEMIRQSEESIREIFSRVTEAVYIQDAEGRFVDVNAAAEKMYGYPREFFLGKTPEFLTAPDKNDMSQTIEAIHKAYSGDPQVFEFWGLRSNGEIFPKEISLTSGTYQGERVIIAVARDITRRKQVEVALQESEKRFQAIVSVMPDILFSLDNQGTYLTCQANEINLLLLPKEDLIGKSIKELLPPQIASQGILAIEKAIESDRLQFFEYSLDLPTGRKWFEIRIVKSAADEVVAIVRDITDRKHEEEALRESNKKLRLLTGLTRHDIFNQLSAIEILHTMALQTSDPVKVKEIISRAQEAGNQIEKTIGFTREYENFGTVSSSWQQIRRLIESAKTEVSLGSVTTENQISPDLRVYADPIIRKVFTTLMENAIRHGGDLSNIRFLCSEREETLIITCNDDGVGIPLGEKEYIFDHGYGKHTGIGLFLAREILSITGLSIRECGEPGEGARFEILVPKGKYRGE